MSRLFIVPSSLFVGIVSFNAVWKGCIQSIKAVSNSIHEIVEMTRFGFDIFNDSYPLVIWYWNIKKSCLNSPKKWWWTQSGTNLAAYSQALQMWAFKSNPLSIFYNWWSNFSRACNFQGNGLDLYSPIANLWGSRSRSCYQTASPHNQCTTTRKYANRVNVTTHTFDIGGIRAPHKRLIIFGTIQSATQSLVCVLLFMCALLCVSWGVCVSVLEESRQTGAVGKPLEASGTIVRSLLTCVCLRVYFCRLLLLCTSMSTSVDFYFCVLLCLLL